MSVDALFLIFDPGLLLLGLWLYGRKREPRWITAERPEDTYWPNGGK